MTVIRALVFNNKNQFKVLHSPFDDCVSHRPIYCPVIVKQVVSDLNLSPQPHARGLDIMFNYEFENWGKSYFDLIHIQSILNVYQDLYNI